LLVREPMSEHNASPSSHAFLVDIGHHQLKNPILRQSLGLRSDGSIFAWGRDDYGQVSMAPAGDDFIAVSAGSYHGAALKIDGTIVTWGNNEWGQISLTPTESHFVAVDAGSKHNIALTDGGAIVCWGDDGFSQVSHTPLGTGYREVQAGTNDSLALRSDGSILSWGDVGYAPSGYGFIAIDAGDRVNAALRADGSIVAWGWAGHPILRDIPSETGFVDVEIGADYGVALTPEPGTLVLLSAGLMALRCSRRFGVDRC